MIFFSDNRIGTSGVDFLCKKIAKLENLLTLHLGLRYFFYQNTFNILYFLKK